MFREGATATFRCSISLLAGLVLLLSAGRAAGEASEALERGRSLVQSFEYEAALEQLESVVMDDRASAEQRVEALELMGVLHFNLNRRPRSRQMFERLLNFDPGHELTDTSYPPRLLRFFASIRESFMPQVQLDVVVDALQDPPGTGPLLIEATVSGSSGGVAQAVALVRRVGEESYRRALMSREGEDFFAEIPLETGENDFEYYVEVAAPSGYVLTSVGSADNPRRASAEALEESSLEPSDGPDDITSGEEPGDDDGGDGGRRRWYRTWWFWTIVGVVVAGGVATAVVLTLPDGDQEGTLGTRSLP